MNTLVDKLKAMGFNSYEARVYLALLQRHPATGYEISKESGVPQARAYDTLKALETNRCVVALGGKPALYSPVSPEELLTRWERNFTGTVSFLRDALPKLNDDAMDPMTNLRGEEAIFSHANEMIRHAQNGVYMEVWNEDLPQLEAALQEAMARQVEVRIVGYNKPQLPGALVFDHSHGQKIEHLLGSRWVILSVDDQEGLVGTFPLHGENNGSSATPHGVFTRNGGLVLIIKMLIVHDMFLIDVEHHLHEEMEKAYGKGLLRLREKILGPGATIGFH